MPRSIFPITLLAAVLVASVACAQEADNNPLVLAGPSPESTEAPEAPNDPDQLVSTALEDVQRFWEEAYPEVYSGEFEPLSDFVPYNSNTNPLPCEAPDYETVANNAFYCQPPYDVIAWDEEGLIPTLVEDYGPFTVAIVFAHEFGHAVQARAGVREDTLIMEQQGDCFAGAWTRWIAEGNSDNFGIAEATLDNALAGFISFSDAPGTSGDDPMAHGSGFDRIGAFQDGWANSASKCTTYPDEPPSTVEIPFINEEDLANEGNLHLEDEGDDPGLFTLIEENLNVYYELRFEDLGETWEPIELTILEPGTESLDCGGETISGDDLEFLSVYCEDERQVVLSSDLIYEGFGEVPPLEELGDFAVGAEIGRLWARAAQLQLGADGENLETSLQADCLMGVWAGDNFPDENGSTDLIEELEERGESDRNRLLMSPGDLDEAILGFLTYGQALREETGTAFERYAALRLGFLGEPGFEECETEYGDLG